MGSQGILPFFYEEEKTKSGMTSFSGLPLYLDLYHAIGLREIIAEHIKVRSGDQGWREDQIVLSLLLLHLVGGDHVEDIRMLEQDEGIARLLQSCVWREVGRKAAREQAREKGNRNNLPSPSTIFRFLEAFHTEAEEEKREAGKAFIPEETELLQGLYQVNAGMQQFMQRYNPRETATLDIDATIVGSMKEEALFCYKGYKAYQPLTIRWAEQQVVVHSQFRDGNVPAGLNQLGVLQEALDMLPEGIEKVYLRSDTAGYEWDFIRYCAEGKHERFGVIEFAIGVDVTAEFKKAVGSVPEIEWHAVDRVVEGVSYPSSQEWAEVNFVPYNATKSPGQVAYRFIAIREALAQQKSLPGIEPQQLELPFPTMTLQQKLYKITGILTNRSLAGNDLIHWSRGRCGGGEHVHDIMKNELGGGTLPSGKFGANAAWWAIMVLAFNLFMIMNVVVLGGLWVSKRVKALRLSLICVAGRVSQRSHQFFIRLKATHPCLKLLLHAREKILELVTLPACSLE